MRCAVDENDSDEYDARLLCESCRSRAKHSLPCCLTLLVSVGYGQILRGYCLSFSRTSTLAFINSMFIFCCDREHVLLFFCAIHSPNIHPVPWGESVASRDEPLSPSALASRSVIERGAPFFSSLLLSLRLF